MGAERFAPGVLLAGRYRIVALLGKGGMGEVYRADDLSLGQSVALKFLPRAVSSDRIRLSHFRDEVRIARGVSHPNVCRVYDLAEVDGQPFLTMEHIDGEDLAVLLKRIGRLPEEKGVELARQMCLGLAAAHEKGVLHRDLKPANVMLDGRGQVRITDFGLAAVAGAVEDVRSGTPAYMAPEQLAGKDVSVQSDLFSLGLILYELFTGKKAFPARTPDELRKLHEEGTPSKPSSHVSGLNPAVERVILRCLQKNPEDRPRSAYEVAAGLPGGDPLAAALAAGETPSPRMVADAGGEGTIAPRVGAALLAAVVVSVGLLAVLADRTMLFRLVPITERPEVMARQAQRLLADLGYPDRASDSAHGYRANGRYLMYVMYTDSSPGRWDNLPTGRAPAFTFFYRQALDDLVPALGRSGGPFEVTPDNPPPTSPAMAGVLLDPRGRLLHLYVVPPRHDPGVTEPISDGWWRPLFSAAGLESNQFERTDPEYRPPFDCDERKAWLGRLPELPDVEVRIEAGCWRGKPAYFEINFPWDEAGAVPSSAGSPLLGVAIVLLVLGGAVALAIRNLRLGKGDPRGSVRLGAILAGGLVLCWILGGHHVFSFPSENRQLMTVLGFGVWMGLVTCGFYLALEPAVRRRWPWRITGWGRLLAGRVRDPMIGRDFLIGLIFGCGMALTLRAHFLFAEWLRLPPPAPASGEGTTGFADPGPPSPLVNILASILGNAVYVPLMLLMIAFLLALVLRFTWLSWGVWLLIWVAVFATPYLGPSTGANILAVAFTALNLGLLGFALARFGLLAASCALVGETLLCLTPPTTDTSAWYFWQGAVGALVVVGLAVYGFVTATRGQRLFREGFFGDA
jgi:serine/threonine-protein kinase